MNKESKSFRRRSWVGNFGAWAENYFLIITFYFIYLGGVFTFIYFEENKWTPFWNYLYRVMV